MAIRWTEELAVGHAAIDAQHQDLIARFDQLIDATRQGQGKKRLHELLDYLLDYVDVHFAAEEALMLNSAYPLRAAHIDEHRRFRAEAAALKSAWLNSGATLELMVRTNETVHAWLIEHIRRTDRALGTFLRESRAA